MPADTPPVPLPEDHPHVAAVRPWVAPLAVALFLLVLVSAAGYIFLNLSACRAFSPFATRWLEGLIGPIGGLAFAILGLVIIYARPANRIGWLCSVGGLGLALGADLEIYMSCALAGKISPPGLGMTAWFAYTVQSLLVILPIFIFLPLLFPNGRFLTQRWRNFTLVLLGTISILYLAVAVTPDFRQDNGFGTSYSLDNPLRLSWLPPWWGTFFTTALNLLIIFGSLAAVVSLILRLKRSRGEERQQVKLFAYWAVAVIIQLVVFELAAARLFPLLEDTVWRDLILFAYDLILIFVFLGFPLVVGIAIFKYRLYDIDIIINRTLVYGGLSLGVVVVYVLVVGALGALFQSQGSFLFALLATGLIAVLFQPVRQRLQRGVNRLMFGERDDPYEVLSRLGRRLRETAVPSQALPAITATITQTLKLPYAAIELAEANGQQHTVAVSGERSDGVESWPLIYQGEIVGWLQVAPRSPGEAFTARERQLLEDIATQAGAAAYSVRLTTALQKSRERLVLAREEERRRIRRDLHDELGPSLASQTFKLDAAIDLLETDSQAAAELLKSLKAQNQALVSDIRRLVYELRPAALDELGLMGALQAHISQIDTPAMTLAAVPDPIPPLPAAVEVAAYRIALEATNNVVRHAGAQTCAVNLEAADSCLTLTISDDGVGLPAKRRNGVGLRSMRERAEELGGTLMMGSLVDGGTRVTAALPM